jgi:hypothetical protein
MQQGRIRQLDSQTPVLHKDRGNRGKIAIVQAKQIERTALKRREHFTDSMWVGAQ